MLWKNGLGPLTEFFDVDGRFSFNFELKSAFIVMPERMLEYTGDIFGEYFDDFGVRSFRATGSSSFGFIILRRLLDI